MQAVDGLLNDLLPRMDLRVDIPFLLSILGNILITSNDTNITPGGNLCSFNVSIISKRRPVSFIREDILDVSREHTVSTKNDRFSIAVLHPVVNSLTSIYIYICIYVFMGILSLSHTRVEPHAHTNILEVLHAVNVH